MTKENAAAELILAVRRLHRGERYVCPAVAERLALSIAMFEPDEMLHTRLSTREFKVFEMLVAGKRGWEIAQELTLSEKTVSTHKAHVLRKMNVTNRTELLLYAVKHQLVSV
jgi:DNA-binding NarL/FixJ family response regulator